MRKKYLVILPTILMAFFYGCKKKEGPTGATGPIGSPGPAYYGVIRGHISLYDEYGVKSFFNLNGIKINLNDTISILTDTAGYYRFDSVVTGNYNIIASKTGYGSTRTGYFAFINDTLYKNLKMSANPWFNILTFSAFYCPGTDYDSAVATVNVDTRLRNMIVFVSNKPSVSSSNYLLAYVKSIPANFVTRVGIRIAANELNKAGIFYGEVAYYAAYSYVINDASVYEDPLTGNNIYTAVGTALADTALAP